MGAGSYDVLGDAEAVSRMARHVRIDEAAIEAWAEQVDPAEVQPAAKPAELRMEGAREEIACWVLLLDALNFCFWTASGPAWTVNYGGQKWRRYPALLAALHRAVSADRRWLDPTYWAEAPAPTIEAMLAGDNGVPIPMAADRVRIVHETGRVAVAELGGRPLRLLERAEGDAARLAGVVADLFPSFHDVHGYRGRRVAILKRPQIFAADLAAALAETGEPGATGLDGLTAFADYRIPQVLRHLGILQLDAIFESHIEAGDLIAAGSVEEVELRACSIRAVQQMVGALRRAHGADVPAWRVDEHLWERSHDPGVRVQHHRTLTWFY